MDKEKPVFIASEFFGKEGVRISKFKVKIEEIGKDEKKPY